jgi:hypothetical protein
MKLRTIAMLTAVVAMPAAATAQDHKCACCANKHASHEAHATTTTPLPSGEPQAHAATPGHLPTYGEYEGLFSGIVYSVMRHQGMDVQLSVGVGEETFEVVVAPMDWLDRKNVVFRPGERVEIVGSRQDPAAPHTIIAREIRTASQTVVLRNADGKALWP